MLSVLEKLINKTKKNKDLIQEANIESLEIGDMILFNKSDYSSISSKIFRVEKKNIYNILGRAIIEHTLKLEDTEIFISEFDNLLKVRIELTVDNVAEIFGLKEFSTIYSNSLKVKLASHFVSDEMQGIISSLYNKKIDCAEGIYSGDNHTQEKLKLDYYYLEDNAGKYFIESEIYEEIEGKVFAGFYASKSLIKEVISYL